MLRNTFLCLNKHSAQVAGADQILLLFDELPRFGKLEMIAYAVATLRNKM